MPAFKKLTAATKAELVAQLASDAIRKFVEQTKAAQDSGTFEVVISTPDLDRQGEIIDQAGWDFTHYLANPVVLWAHDYWSLPIGITDSIGLNNDGKLVAKGRFAPADANPFAQQVRRLYDLKIVRATSVGFIDHEMDGNKIVKAELLEFSFVPVPANPFALSLSKAQELGLDLAMIRAKGLELKVDERAKQAQAKGEISDQVNEDEKRKAKWAKLNRVWDIFDAFIGVYLDNAIPVEDFEKLLDEAITLMKTPAEKTQEIETGAVGAALAHPDRRKVLLHLKDLEKIGATLAATQGEIDDAFVRGAKAVLAIVSEEYGEGGAPKATPTINPSKDSAAGPDNGAGDAGEERRDGGAPNQRSQGAGTATQELDEFLMARQLLRSVTTTANAALERMNKKIRERSTKR